MTFYIDAMKRILASLAAIAMAASPALASAKSPLEGRWQHGSMVIEIAPCGPELCGTVVKASPTQQKKAQKGSGTELIGARIITDIEQTGDNTYKGRVFAADRDMYASGTVRMVSHDRLQVKGCILLIICKSRTYDRVR
jgi:uncharacterized protein (DUF2147 family)